MLGVADHARHRVTPRNEQWCEQQRDLAVAADDEDARHVGLPAGSHPRYASAPTRGRDYDLEVATARAICAIWSGPTRQHPPTSRAPPVTQSPASAAMADASPDQRRASGFQRSPLFG